MIVKRLILKKVLSSGIVAEVYLVKRDGFYEAALYLSGKYIGGPPLPLPLNPPKGDVEYWMGNRPTVGLTKSDAEKIEAEVGAENEIVRYRRRKGWDDVEK